MTLLCVPIPVHDIDAALRDARAAKDAGADLVEYRIDDLFHGTDEQSSGDTYETRQILRLVADSPLPCIITCRPAQGGEGGTYDGPDDARISLFERLGTAFGRFPDGTPEHPPRYIDLELSTWQRSANIRQKIKLAINHPEQLRDLKTSLILSTHDFSGRPPDLSRRLLAMRESPAAILKVAYLARSLRDNLELFDLLARRDRPTIALAMGEHGLMSRILAPKFGAFLTFASLRPTTTTAPGQPTIHELLHTYRFRSINENTAVYGVVGHPVSHSLSPHLHNAGLESHDLNAVYLPLPVAPGYEPFKATLLELIHDAPLNLRGLSVTLPHKENLVRLAREQGWPLDEPSAAIGAANTLTITRDPSGQPTHAAVSNTDIPALLASLTSALGDMTQKRVAILGAGGVARAAAHACLGAGASVAIFNRTRASADQLVADLAASGYPHAPRGIPPTTPGQSQSPLSPLHAISSPAGRTIVARGAAQQAPGIQPYSPPARRADETIPNPGQSHGLENAIALPTTPALSAADLPALSTTPFDLYINATPLGMTDGPDPAAVPLPIPDIARLNPAAAVMDTIYTPLTTPLLSQAQAAGLTAIPGLPMFIAQAAAQFSVWTDRPAPTALFERIAREKLSP